jgi:hypothetical protein
MSEPVKAALIVAAWLLIAMGMWIYFSPYHSCVRSWPSTAIGNAGFRCAEAIGGNR